VDGAGGEGNVGKIRDKKSIGEGDIQLESKEKKVDMMKILSCSGVFNTIEISPTKTQTLEYKLELTNPDPTVQENPRIVWVVISIGQKRDI